MAAENKSNEDKSATVLSQRELKLSNLNLATSLIDPNSPQSSIIRLDKFQKWPITQFLTPKDISIIRYY